MVVVVGYNFYGDIGRYSVASVFPTCAFGAERTCGNGFEHSAGFDWKIGWVRYQTRDIKGRFAATEAQPVSIVAWSCGVGAERESLDIHRQRFVATGE